MKKYTSIPEYYLDYTPAQAQLAGDIIKALEDFGIGKLQRNMPVYYKDNLIQRPTKNQSRRYFGKSDCKKKGKLYLGFYDITHFLDQHPHVSYMFDRIQKVSGQVWINTPDDCARAAALIALSKNL